MLEEIEISWILSGAKAGTMPGTLKASTILSPFIKAKNIGSVGALSTLFGLIIPQILISYSLFAITSKA